jgi:hypothetical protein
LRPAGHRQKADESRVKGVVSAVLMRHRAPSARVESRGANDCPVGRVVHRGRPGLRRACARSERAPAARACLGALMLVGFQLEAACRTAPAGECSCGHRPERSLGGWPQADRPPWRCRVGGGRGRGGRQIQEMPRIVRSFRDGASADVGSRRCEHVRCGSARCPPTRVAAARHRAP